MAIRFCDNEVYCINKTELSRGKLVSFFFKNDLKDIVYVTDEEGKFEGIILYKNLIGVDNVETAIQKEKVVFNEDIWENARKCFKYNSNVKFLPVVNENNELEYFCYNDPRQNHLINKIRRLSEIEKPLLVVNKYSNIECVNIYDLNEVSYYLYQFLKRNNMTVNIYGEKWNSLEGEVCNNNNYMDSSILNVYSEGISSNRQIKKDMNELLLNDVSGYFEFVEDLYNENKNCIDQLHVINDWYAILEGLKNETRPIILEGRGWMVEKAYDHLIGKGIFPNCFCSYKRQWNGIKRKNLMLFGIPLYNEKECLHEFPDAVYLLMNGKNTLSSRREELEYYSYNFGESCFDLTDYINTVPENALGNVILSRETILIGDSYLCSRLYNTLKLSGKTRIHYCYSLGNKIGNLPEGLMQFSIDECIYNCPNATYYILDRIGNPDNGSTYKINSILKLLEERNINDFSLYFWWNLIPFAQTTSTVSNECNDFSIDEPGIHRMQIEDVDKIIYGVTEAYTGNVFIRTILEKHPQILALPMNVLSNCIWFYVEELTNQCEVLDIPEKLVDLIQLHLEEKQEEIKNVLPNVSSFKRELKEILGGRKKITGQELLVAVSIACFYMEGKKFKKIDSPILYWEPHNNSREKPLVMCYQSWLKAHFKEVYVLKLVRNPIQVAGSVLRSSFDRKAFSAALLESKSYSVEGIDKSNENFITIRFEDLKLVPQKVLSYLCKVFGITYSEEYLELIKTGNLRTYSNSEYTVTGLDLRPVYNQYEQYFNSFDIFRMNIMFAAKHKAYGYPYQDISMFSKQQILDWFKIPFKFEALIEFGTEEAKTTFRYQMYKCNIRSIELQENLEDNKDLFSFADYYKV